MNLTHDKAGTGMTVGFPGQPFANLADDIILARHPGVHMVSASPFMAALRTPLEHESSGPFDLTLNTIAAMRIINPHCLIPSLSALDMVGRSGQLAGLMAGANIVTVNFTPQEQVRRCPIYGRERFVVSAGHVDDLLRAAKLERSGLVWLQPWNGSHAEHT